MLLIIFAVTKLTNTTIDYVLFVALVTALSEKLTENSIYRKRILVLFQKKKTSQNMEVEYSLNPFQAEVIERLTRIENAIATFGSQTDLVQELIRKEIRSNNYNYNNNNNNGGGNNNEQRPMWFMVQTVKNQEDVPLCIRISGRTYDIRDRIKQFGALWKNETKSWEVEYSNEVYNAIVSFLQTLTADVKEDTVVVIV